MASREVSRRIFTVNGNLGFASFGSVWATGVETTALWGICGRGNISLQNYSVHLHVRIGIWNGGEESLGVWMERIFEDILLATEFHHRAKVHNADLVRYELNDRQVV